MKRTIAVLSLILMLASPALADRIICASTTSTLNSGLFDHILPIFTKKTGIDVHVVAVGTGAALEMGKRGDADVLLVHAKDRELKGVKEGYYVNRHDVMYNDFVIVGPKGTKNDFSGIKDASAAFLKISSSKLPFASRGDNSGTHMRELSIWKAAVVEPKGNGWYMETGQGMAKTLRIANEKRAYALTDRGTWLSMKDRDRLGVEIVFEGDPALYNQYGVMAVNPERHRHVKIKEAFAFIDWLISKEGQEAIGGYRDSGGNQLFTPDAD